MPVTVTEGGVGRGASPTAAAAAVSVHAGAADPHGDRAYADSRIAAQSSAFDFERDFHAPADGAADATGALQSAVDAMFAAGGGKLVCRSRHYKITNVNWPAANPYTAQAVTIVIEGVLPQAVVPFCPGSGGSSFNAPLPTSGTIFDSSAAAGDVFGGISAISNLNIVLRNLIVRVPANPQCNGIHGGWLTNLTTENVMVFARAAGDLDPTTGHGPAEFVQPTNVGSIGIQYPGEGNGGDVRATNTTVAGFYVGYTHSEHLIRDNMTTFKCIVGRRPIDGWHASTGGRESIYWCKTGIQPKLNGANQTNPAATKPITRCVDSQVDFEETDEAAAWYKTVAHVDDPYNRLRGRMRTHRMKAGVGISGPLLRNGAALLDLAPVGSLPRSVLDVASFAAADSAAALPNSANGVPPTILRGTWGVSGLQAYIATTSASDCIAVYNVGTSSVTLHTKLTTNSAGSRSVGLALNAVDASNFILVAVDSGGAGTVKLQKVVAGAYTTLGSGAFANTSGATYDMLVVQSGGRITVYMDGVLIVTVVLAAADWTTFSAGVSHGFYSWTGAGFDTGTSRWGFLRFESPGMVSA